MPHSPRVSVIVPAHNYARFLPETLDSVLAQTFGDWECIIVDDGSTDATAAVAASYVERDSRIRYVHQANRGLAAARNTGLAQARGELIQFLDADDRLASSKLETHVAFLDSHSGTDVAYSEVGFFRSENPLQLTPSLGGRLSQSIMARVHGSDEAFEKLEHFNIMPVLAALVRRGAFERAGSFDEAAPSCEDWGLWIRCAAAGCRFDFVDAPEPLAAVRSHGQSMSRDHTRMTRGLIAIARAFQESPVSTANGRFPLAYEVALGIETALYRSRREGSRRIWSAAARATETLTGLRWYLYAAAAWLPRPLFLRIVSTPIPETPFEWYRRVRRLLGRYRS
jgi:glycosyltransferase involved in cell wall biosynthesis